MPDIWNKLNLKDHNKIIILNAPASFEESIKELEGVKVHRNHDTVDDIQFVLVFATQKQEIRNIASKLISKTKGDAIVWFCYPRATSKKYTCDFNRDNGWESIKSLGFRGVR